MWLILLRLPTFDFLTWTRTGCLWKSAPRWTAMSGASAVFILDLKGKVIISRNYRGEVPVTVTERFVTKNVASVGERPTLKMWDFTDACYCKSSFRFQQNVIEQEDSLVKPVFIEDGITFCWITFNNLYCKSHIFLQYISKQKANGWGFLGQGSKRYPTLYLLQCLLLLNEMRMQCLSWPSFTGSLRSVGLISLVEAVVKPLCPSVDSKTARSLRAVGSLGCVHTG
jgi:hypothetical protein